MNAGRPGAIALGALLFGYAFLYGPIAVLLVYSFNESRLVTVWGGLSLRWYGALFADARMIEAAWLSLRIAAASATAAVVLGTAAAFALVRFGRFRGRTLFSAMLLAPLIIPEVITGLSLLLLFVWLENLIGWPAGRGATTIGLAHVTIGISYAAVVVRARLVRLDPDLDAAAADLGARPFAAFRQVTLPLLAPALAAAWLLAFTLSLDDLVVASFVTGPGASTLPIVVFSSVRLGVTPEVNALAALLVAFVATAVGISAWMLHRRERRRLRSSRQPA
jgi:putrescine transport system permease protein